MYVSHVWFTLRGSERGSDLPKITGQILAENFLVWAQTHERGPVAPSLSLPVPLALCPMGWLQGCWRPGRVVLSFFSVSPRAHSWAPHADWREKAGVSTVFYTMGMGQGEGMGGSKAPRLWGSEAAQDCQVERPVSLLPFTVTPCLWPTILSQKNSWAAGAVSAHPGQHPLLWWWRPQDLWEKVQNTLSMQSPFCTLGWVLSSKMNIFLDASAHQTWRCLWLIDI